MAPHRTEASNRWQTGGRHPRGARRRVWSYQPLLGSLECRTLLAGPPDIPAAAVSLALDSPLAGTIAPLAATYYRISSDMAGKLTVMLQAPGFPARLSLVDPQGQPLVQSDGPATGAGDGWIDVNVPAGDDFLELQSLGRGGTYQITADLTPTTPPFQTVPTLFAGYSPIAVGTFYGDGSPVDLVAPDGIHVGNGDGTFQSTVVDGPLGDPGWTVTAIAAGEFKRDDLPDIAFTEISPDGTTAQLRVLLNQGGGQFQLSAPLAVDSQPVAIQTIDFGNGIMDLAVADYTTGDVAIFVGDGQGGFTPGPILDGGTSPVAMTAGRFGDGHVDLIVADQGDPDTGAGQGLTMFQDDGPGQFDLAATIPLASSPSAVVAGDFGNGHLDLAIASYNANDVTVLLGNGTFQLQAPSSYPVGNDPVAIVASSLRDDGRLDLVTANENSEDVSVLVGNGDGTFQPQARFGAGLFPGALVTADFNGDQRPDLAVGNLGSSDISILLGRGDGTFQDQVTNPVGVGPVGAVAADLNHDGHLDIITTNYYSNDISVLMGNGDGTFQAAQSVPAGEAPSALVVGDFNGDGRLDVAVADAGAGDGTGQGVAILLGDGDGTFQAPIFYGAGTDPSSIVAGDFTGNGVLDLAVADHGSGDVSILLGDGHGGFTTLPPISLGVQASEPISIVAGNFTRDGVLDLAVLNQGTDNVSILQGDGRGGFQALPPIPLDDPLDTPQALAAGAFTGNGLDDLAVVSAGSGGPDLVSVILARGHRTFTLLPSIPLGTGLNPTSIVAAQLLGGGPLVLAIADSYSNQVSLLEGDGRGGFQILPALDIGSGGAPSVVTTGDFTGDGQLDLAIAQQGPNSVTIELNQGNGQFAQPGPVGLAVQNTPLVADLNGDGVPDVTIVDGAGDILFRQGQPAKPGSFDPPITINPGDPSRGIAVVTTNRGTFLASVDATSNAVSLFAFSDGRFSLAGTLATGIQPAQIVSADLEGNGQDDLVVRNAGDGTLTVYMSNGRGGFRPPINIAVGPGIADLSVADLTQDGLLDLLLANQTAGEVEVIRNLGDAGFSSPTLYRAGAGLSAEIGGTGTTPLSLVSQDGTVGVAAGALTPGGLPVLVALDSGAETLGVLTGLGGGRFSNPYTLPTSGATSVIRIADLSRSGKPDLAILGPDGLTIWLDNGRGGFVRGPTYDVGPDPTGLTIADVNGDNLPDLVVGNPFGDVLVLLGEGNGLFRPPIDADQSVGLAVDQLAGTGNMAFIFVDQARDRIVVQNGPMAQPTVLADRTTGLLVPGAPVLADLSGDGIPDLIVPNGGDNNVLVYPGLPGGGFGPSMNDGNGFFTGTNPVSVTVADVNGDGRLDLLVANKGSNDVSILLNEPLGNSFTFVPGPRLRVGSGPVSVLFGDFTRDGIPDLLVSNSGSNDLMLLPGLGDGFFNDVSPTIVPMSQSPGAIFAGPFGVGTGPDIVALNPGTGDVTLISGLSTGAPVSQIFSSGGLDPVAAFAVAGPDGFEDLVIANNADGRVALLAGGPHGLTLEEVDSSPDLLSPTALALASVQNDFLEFYAATAGQETASLLVFSLSELSTSTPNGSAPGLTLLPLPDSSLPLIATLLTPFVDLNASEEEPGGQQGATATVVTATASTAISLGQGPFGNTGEHDDLGIDGDLASERDMAPPAASDRAGSFPWKRVVRGLEEAFDEFRRATQPDPQSDERLLQDEENSFPASDQPDSLLDSVSRVRESEIIDAAIDSLAMPALGPDRLPGMTTVRLEPIPLTWMALSILYGGLVRIRVRGNEKGTSPITESTISYGSARASA